MVSIEALSFSPLEKVAGEAGRMRVFHAQLHAKGQAR
jgi:hypothetical protein